LGIGLRRRELLFFAGVAVALAALAVRLLWLQVFRGDQFRQGGLDARMRAIPVQAPRGAILDRDGRPLAVSVNVYSVYAIPAQVTDKPGEARRLAAVLGLPYERVLRILERRSVSEWIQRKVTDAQAEAIRRLRLPGIDLTVETERRYPKGALAASVVGFAGIDNQGLAGVEYFYDGYLRGRDGRVEMEYDAFNQSIPVGDRRYVAPTPGLTLRLTLDENLQYLAERDLVRGVLQAGAKGGYVLIMDPRNGEILAMASYPTFDPNHFADYDPALWKNALVADTISPGSVFKPITAAAALNEGVVTPDTGFYDPGSFTVPGIGVAIHNWDSSGRGATTFRQGFTDSANVVFAQTGLRLGKERFYQYLDRFGLLTHTGIDLPGEGLGLVPPQGEATALDLAIMSFGQTLTLTPIGVATAMAAAINGGKLFWPHVARGFYDARGQLVRPVPPRLVRQVVRPEVSAVLRDLMKGVVEEGTGRRAQVPGFWVGGKTGTTNKVVGGVVSTSHYIGSFIGFVPLGDPRLLVYIMIDEPSGTPYGGWVAAPLFRDIVADALQYLRVPPERPPAGGVGADAPAPASVPVPNLINLTPADAQARAAAAGLRMEVEGSGPRIGSQTPAAGVPVPAGTVVVARAGAWRPAESYLVTVPDLSGRTLEEAADVLARVGLVLDAGGRGVVTRQDPAPGSRVEAGSAVSVDLAPRP
jgi:stage V sporulation protein D (sporulation-specific penicillin-binding protein)